MSKLVVKENLPKLEDGCVIDSNICSGKPKVCGTCSMIYCDIHYQRKTHLESCAERVKIDRKAMIDYGNTGL